MSDSPGEVQSRAVDEDVNLSHVECRQRNSALNAFLLPARTGYDI